MNVLHELTEAVQRLHGGSPRWSESVEVVEMFGGEVAWRRTVEVFDLSTHPIAQQAFAWMEPVPDSTRVRYFAVLRTGPIETARDAVRASLLQDG